MTRLLWLLWAGLALAGDSPEVGLHLTVAASEPAAMQDGVPTCVCACDPDGGFVRLEAP